MKVLSIVLDTLIRNEPLLESMLVLPLILKRYRTVLIACVLVAVVTFGVEMGNNYAPENLFAAAHIVLFLVQGVILVAVSAVVFRLKLAVLRKFNLLEPAKPKTAAPETAAVD